MACSVYLLHFSAPVSGRFSHYIGKTERPVDVRVAEHRAGRGARLTRRAVRDGIEFVLARVWERVHPDFERELKRRGSTRRNCPVCLVTDKVRGPL